MNNLLPQARTADIIEQEAEQELLIYNLKTNKMFRLNETSKIVYQSCGRMSFDELKRRHRFTDDLIHLALDELKANDLLVDYRSNHFAGLSRREAIKRVGLASLVALPVIAAISAPSAAAAASNSLRANNQTYTTFAVDNSQECQSGNCVPSTNANGFRCCAMFTTFPNGTTGYLFFGVDQAGCTNSAQSGTCCSGAAMYTVNYTCTCL